MYQQSIFDGTEQSMLECSLRLIRDFEEIALFRNPLGYVVGYSGGKDSDVLVHLFKRAGVRFFVMHNHTTLDAPETVYYIRKKFAEFEAQGIPCKIYYPQYSFWQLCKQKKMLPTRRARFCCAELKEAETDRSIRFATHSFGVRKAESVRRAQQRDSIETRNKSDFSDIQRFHFDNTAEVQQTSACYRNNYFIVNPMAYWTDDYLWNYIQGENVEINPLYARGWKRVGCIGCPMAEKPRLMEFEQYPKYRQNFVRLCDDIIQTRNKQNLPNKYGFKNGEEYFNFWLTEEKPCGGVNIGLFENEV